MTTTNYEAGSTEFVMDELGGRLDAQARWTTPVVLEAVNKVVHESVLDVGCGSSVILEEALALMNCQVFCAADKQREMIASRIENNDANPALTWIADGRNLDFLTRDSFDLTTGLAYLGWLGDSDEEGIAEMGRVGKASLSISGNKRR